MNAKHITIETRPLPSNGEVNLDESKQQFLEALNVGGFLHSLYSKRLSLEARRHINFADIFLAYSRATELVNSSASYISDSAQIYTEYEAEPEDMALDLSLESFSQNPDHALVGQQLRDHAIQQNHDSDSILGIDIDGHIMFTADGEKLLEYNKLVNKITAHIASTEPKAPLEVSEEIFKNNRVAFVYFELLELVDKYVRANYREDTKEAQKAGMQINRRIKFLLEEGLKYNVGFGALLDSSELNTNKNNELANRILGVIQEINGVNLFKAAGAFVRVGTEAEDAEAKDTVHALRIDGNNIPTSFDWKSSVSAVMNNKNGSTNNPISIKLNIGGADYILDIACTKSSKENIKFIACLSRCVVGQRLPINRIQSFIVNRGEATLLKHQLDQAAIKAISIIS